MLECIARRFSGNLCASRIASKALRESKRHMITALVDLRSKMELSQSSLQQANGLTEISLKSQLNDYGFEQQLRRSVCIYPDQQFSGFLQFTLGLINAGLRSHSVWIIWRNVQRSIIEL